jgi:L-threonylcarbamoyladenylate synthase
MNTWHISQAARVVRQGGVIAYPTEAVWGLGCDPFNASAVERLLLLKRRPVEKGVILIAASLSQVAPLIDPLTAEEKERLSATWPGPYTWLLPDPHEWVPNWIKGKHSEVAVRISDHPLVRALCTAVDGPLVSTSANPGGAAPAKSLWEVNAYFGSRLDYKVDGKLGGLGRPTRIQSLQGSKIIRN